MVSFSLGIAIGIICGIIVILTIILKILTKKEKGLKKELLVVEGKGRYLKRVDELMKSDKNSEAILDALDILSKDYFEEKYKIDRGIDYSEIRAEMLRRGEKESAQFAQEMVKALYSGKKMKLIFLQEIMKTFRDLIQPSPLPKDLNYIQEKEQEVKVTINYEDAKNVKSHPKLPQAESMPPKQIRLLKDAKDAGEVIFPVIKKSFEDENEVKQQKIKEKEKESEFRSAFKKESLTKELPAKLQEEIAQEESEIDAGKNLNKIKEPQEPMDKKDKFDKNLKKNLLIPPGLYSHLR